jgi:hypothetical protein
MALAQMKRPSGVGTRQGDQIGRIFAQWVIVYYLKFSRKLQAWSKCLGHILEWKKICFNFEQKKVWATFWVIFPQTHPVTPAPVPAASFTLIQIVTFVLPTFLNDVYFTHIFK